MALERFSEVIDRALSDGPQTITRKGREAVVVVSTEEWNRKTKRKATSLSSSPPRRCEAQALGSTGPRIGREIEL